MASGVQTNVDLNSANSKVDISLKDDKLLDSQTADQILDNIDTRFTNPDGAQSPASSTYADCEENDSPTNENEKLISADGTEKEYIIEIISKKVQETCETKDSSELSVTETETNTDDLIICAEDMNDCGGQNSNKHVAVKENKSIENDIDVITKTEEFYSNGSINIETESELYEIEHDQDNENYESEEQPKSLDKTDPENEECSDFDSTEHENDRENGDGQEVTEEDAAAAQKKLDDDEDRRNPQYIPKKGFFYEHDDRTACTSSDDETAGDTAKKESEPKDLEGKGRERQIIPDGKWQHDLYRDDEQKPKSAQELIDIYGYDIRNEESAPKARRRRKYGRGPNKYTRKWNDENAYDKQILNKRVRTPRQKLPHKRDEYEAEFPTIKGRRDRLTVGSQEQRDITPKRSDVTPKRRDVTPKQRDMTPKRRDVTPKRAYNLSASRSDTEIRFKEDYRNHTAPRTNSQYPEKSRSFTKRISRSKDRCVPDYDGVGSNDVRQIQKSFRAPVVVTVHTAHSRGRGIGHGKNLRYENSYEPDRTQQLSKMQFTSANRGRAKRLVRPSQQYSPGKLANEDEMRELSNQMSSIDLRTVKRTIINKDLYADNVKLTEQSQSLPATTHASSTVGSKRYSHQRQRLLPDSNGQNVVTSVNMMPTQNIQSISHNVQNVHTEPLSEVQTRTTLTYVPQTQLASPSQNPEASLSVNAPTIPSSSLAVSASLIPLSAPPLTASAASMPGTAPPLPIVGFFQHPQDSVLGFTNQGTPAQLYARDQGVMTGPSNQQVQLVAFLPASPMLSNTNHSQSAPPPPPPPPPPSFPTAVMTYPQASQTQQTAASFNSESYSIPPVTLAPMHQAPEMFQSRGGVTYYNTRSQFKPRSPPPPRVKLAIPIVPPPSSETMK